MNSPQFTPGNGTAAEMSVTGVLSCRPQSFARIKKLRFDRGVTFEVL